MYHNFFQNQPTPPLRRTTFLWPYLVYCTRGGHEIPERGVSLLGSPGNKNSGKLGKNSRDQFSIDQYGGTSAMGDVFVQDDDRYFPDD